MYVGKCCWSRLRIIGLRLFLFFLMLQAPPLLREVLPEEGCGDRSSIQSNESSYSLPSIPNDGGEIKQAKHAPQLDGTGKQGNKC